MTELTKYEEVYSGVNTRVLEVVYDGDRYTITASVIESPVRIDGMKPYLYIRTFAYVTFPECVTLSESVEYTDGMHLLRCLDRDQVDSDLFDVVDDLREKL